MIPQVKKWLRTVALRIRFRRAIRWGFTGLLAWGVVGLILAATARLTPLGWEKVAVLSMGCVVFVAMIAGFVARLSPEKVARAADKDLASKDRIASTLFLLRRADHNSTDHNNVERAQIDSTMVSLAGWRQKTAAPMRVPRARAGAAILLAAMVATLLASHNPLDDVVGQRKAEAKAISAEASKLKEKAEQIAKSDLPETEKLALSKELEQAAERLAKSETLKHALEELAKADSKIQALQRSDALATKALLASIDSQLAKDALAEGIKGNLENQLQDLSQITSKLSEAEKAQLAEKLGELAGSLSSADSKLADALRDAAAGLKSGDAKGALARAAQAAAKARGKVSAQQSASAARSTVQGAQGRLAQMAGQSGQSRNGGSEGGAGQGQGQKAGQSGNGKGTGGKGNNPGQSGQGQGGKEGGLGPGGPSQSEVYVPHFLQRSADELSIEGSELGAGPQETTGQRFGPRTDGQVLVPLQSVLPSWTRKAGRTVDTLPIQASVRILVRNYFAALNQPAL